MLPALTEVAGERALVTVAEFDVYLQGGERCTGHVTQWALYVIHWMGKKDKGQRFKKTKGQGMPI